MRVRSRALLLLLAATALAACGCSTADPEGQPAPPAETRPPRTPAQPELTYVALGDSFTAAPGLTGSDSPDGCLRSSENYPSLVAEGLEADFDVELTDRSCSAADTTSLTGEQMIGRAALPPQLDALDRSTDLVTLSIGGNDLGVFLRLVGGCVALAQQDPRGSPCRDAAAGEGDLLGGAQPLIEQRLVEAVTEIKQRAPRAQVLLVGYPQLAPASGGCPELLPLAAGDVSFAREVNKTLTDNLARTARRTGTTYVDVWSASAGHDICSGQPWVSGRGGQPGGAIPYHPLPAGQRAVAELVVAAVERSTAR